MMALTDELHFKVIHPRDGLETSRAMINATYSMWNGVWSEALKELDGVEKITSDEFSRQCDVGVLCRADEVVASVSFSPVDLTMPMDRDDSYFKVWPSEVLENLARLYPGRRILVGCSFTVKREWRRDAPGFSIKQLMMSLVVEHFLRTKCSAMVGTMRVNKGMGQLAYDAGAEPLVRNAVLHGVDVDLLHWDRSRTLERRNAIPYHAEAQKLYRQFETLPLALPLKRSA